MSDTVTDMSEPKFPDVYVQLSGQDGNAGAIMGAVARALRKAGATSEQVNEFFAEAMSGDYDNVIATSARWVEIG